jgi:HK97 gp10 family phage protein
MSNLSGSSYTQFEIKGLSELQAKLTSLPKKVADKVVRGTLREVAKDQAADFARRAPQRTGFLERHFSVKIKLLRDGDVGGIAFVGPTTDLYPIDDSESSKTDREFKKMLKRSGRGIARPVNASMAARFYEFGTARESANPFMRPSFQSMAQQHLAKIVAGIREALGL